MESDSSRALRDIPEQNPDEEEPGNWVRDFRSRVMTKDSGERFMTQVRENAESILKLTAQWEVYRKAVKLREKSSQNEIFELRMKIGLLEASVENEKEMKLKEEALKKQTLELKVKEEVVEEREKKVEFREVSINESFGLLQEKDKEIKLNEEAVKMQILELKMKEDTIGLLEVSIKERLRLIHEKEKESDLKQLLEAVVMRMVLEMQKEEVVSQLNEQEKSLQDSMKQKHKLMRELEVMKGNVDLLSKLTDAKRCELERKVTDFDLKTSRIREEAELNLKRLEARENELEKKEEKQKEEARDIEAKAKFLEHKEKELDERERKIKEASVQADTRKRSRPSLLAEKGSETDSLIPPAKRHKLIGENTSSDPASEQRTEAKRSGEGYEIVCRADDDVVNLDPEPYSCPEADFHDFRNTRSSFKAGQIWALYDPSDEMPRYYAQIRRVMKSLDVLVTWLESVHNPRNARVIPVACGVFNSGESQTIDNHLTFSHEMKNFTRSDRAITIYPRKGEIWSLFRDWTEAWINEREIHQPPYRYDFVKVLSDFDSERGIGVAYLGAVKGFTSVYVHAEQYGVKQIMIPAEAMLKFSHKVPHVKLNGDEKEGVPPGSFELDPAAIPRACLRATTVKEESLVLDLGF